MGKHLLYILAVCILSTGCYTTGQKHYRQHYSVSKIKALKPNTEFVTITGIIYKTDGRPASYADFGVTGSNLKNSNKEGEFNLSLKPGIYSFSFNYISERITTKKIKIEAGYNYSFKVYLDTIVIITI